MAVGEQRDISEGAVAGGVRFGIKGGAWLNQPSISCSGHPSLSVAAGAALGPLCPVLDGPCTNGRNLRSLRLPELGLLAPLLGRCPEQEAPVLAKMSAAGELALSRKEPVEKPPSIDWGVAKTPSMCCRGRAWRNPAIASRGAELDPRPQDGCTIPGLSPGPVEPIEPRYFRCYFRSSRAVFHVR